MKWNRFPKKNSSDQFWKIFPITMDQKYTGCIVWDEDRMHNIQDMNKYMNTTGISRNCEIQLERIICIIYNDTFIRFRFTIVSSHAIWGMEIRCIWHTNKHCHVFSGAWNSESIWKDSFSSVFFKYYVLWFMYCFADR